MRKANPKMKLVSPPDEKPEIKVKEGTLPDGEEIVRALTRDEVLQAASFNREQAMAAVGLYESIQKVRVAARLKESAHERSVDILGQPAVITAIKDQLYKVEKQCERTLKKYAEAQRLGRWAMSFRGVGGVIAAGLLAHIDMTKAPTAGAVWNFAGLNPDAKWLPGQKRPWNAHLKRICFLLGEAFKKQAPSTKTASLSDEELIDEIIEEWRNEGKEASGKDVIARLREKRALYEAKTEALPGWEYTYVRLYMERKALEVERNGKGAFADQAHARLEEAVKNRWRISAEQRKSWAEGRYQPGALDRRAARYAVKIFLSHFHSVGRQMQGLPIVRPWVIEHGGHSKEILPPNWPMKE